MDNKSAKGPEQRILLLISCLEVVVVVYCGNGVRNEKENQG